MKAIHVRCPRSRESQRPDFLTVLLQPLRKCRSRRGGRLLRRDGLDLEFLSHPFLNFST